LRSRLRATEKRSAGISRQEIIEEIENGVAPRDRPMPLVDRLYRLLGTLLRYETGPLKEPGIPGLPGHGEIPPRLLHPVRTPLGHTA